ncbi:MAG: ATP synthase F1 subunit delta [Bdellovibrionota bacterium]
MSSAISKKYSKALYLVTKTKENTRAVLGELETVYKGTHTDNVVRNFFDDPLTETSTKIASFKKATENSKLSEETVSFLDILIKNHRFSSLGPIISDMHELLDHEQGIQRGVIRAAFPVDEALVKRLESEFEKILKSKVQFTYKESPELVGGLVAEVAGFTFDDSLQNHLNKLTENLTRK